jgi:hypothetical protein
MARLPSQANYSRWRGHGLEPQCWLSLAPGPSYSNFGLSHCCIFFPLEASGMLHLSKYQTKANQGRLASCHGFTRPGSLQPHHHLGSPGSDHFGRKHKDLRDNIYCRHRSYKLAPISTAFPCVGHCLPLGNSVTVLPEKHQPLSQITQWCSAHLLLVWAPVKGQRHAWRTMLMIGIMSQ